MGQNGTRVGRRWDGLGQWGGRKETEWDKLGRNRTFCRPHRVGQMTMARPMASAG